MNDAERERKQLRLRKKREPVFIDSSVKNMAAFMEGTKPEDVADNEMVVVLAASASIAAADALIQALEENLSIIKRADINEQKPGA